MLFRYLLISDGSSDSVLLPIIQFTLKKSFPDLNFIGERGQFYRLIKRPKTLTDRILTGIELYNPDIIFIHRDCEKMSYEHRMQEIDNAVSDIEFEKFVKVIPIRMTESWLLINDKAIRLAVDNPNGKVKLTLPNLNRLESLPDPKHTLNELLKTASELSGRRLASLNLSYAVHLVSDHIKDWRPLLSLTSFNKFLKEVEKLALTA